MKYLIINADDFGMSHEANRAILELLKTGKISSTSLMANGIYYDEAVQMIRENDLQDIGIHLAVTRDGFDAENPLLYRSLTHAKTLEDENGNLYQDINQIKAHVKYSELVQECEEQYKKILKDNINFTHIDNHMYTVVPGLRLKGYVAVVKAYQRVNDRSVRGIRFARKVKPIDNLFEIWTGRKITPIIKILLKCTKLKFVDYVYSFPFNATKVPNLEDKKKCFENFLANIEEGITELHIHPSIYSDEIHLFNPTWQHRVQEYQLFKEIDLEQTLNKYGVTLKTYGELCEKSN
ncbi:carbohydrate deacetylase [Bariatricus sp. SGI.161]|uniref:carbohydrate deacetylase n=1 Tax=Bariatricus sp. SGI.161 TaxID=3420550 RepID=UPI003D0928F8